MAVEEGIDLIVLGARRRRLFDLSVWGTTTERVVRHAPAPVWVVPGGGGGEAASAYGDASRGG